MANEKISRDSIVTFMLATTGWLIATYAILVPFHLTGRRAFFMVLIVTAIHIPFVTGFLFEYISKGNLKKSEEKPSTCGLLILSNYAKQSTGLSFFLSLALVSFYVCTVILAGYALKILQKPAIKWVLAALVAMIFL